MTEDPACALCGRSRTEATALEALSWVTEQDERGPRWLCPTCARRHVRDIEGKLRAEHW
ncbi:hypothetical protein [Actinokineospora enzanensis]|uniref:hypothetical protein n=1 Tax=Actinokineospora enzanensis TaxID=155975 RepID=UPI00039CFBD4|nr:hypothetical protein [Actinokineospora enzanensis]